LSTAVLESAATKILFSSNNAKILPIKVVVFPVQKGQCNNKKSLKFKLFLIKSN
jgi:hypothetical protein